jgi:hypothetical protein
VPQNLYDGLMFNLVKYLFNVQVSQHNFSF